MKNKTYIFVGITLAFLIISCSSDKQDSIIRLTVPLHKSTSGHLSDITENVIPIQLELTDESVIGDWRRGYRVVVTKNNIVFFDNSSNREKILLFKKNGEFIRTIGSIGQGPREYTSVMDIAVDATNQLIYVLSVAKIVCYNFEGDFIMEKPLLRFVETANYINDELVFICTQPVKHEDQYIHETFLYKADKKSNIVDSLVIKQIKKRSGMTFSSTTADYLNALSNDQSFIYYPDKSAPSDTLFAIQNNKLVPSVEVSFDTQDLYSATGIYKTSRFVIITYHIRNYYCYDTHLDKAYTMEAGIMDDIHTHSNVRIRPDPMNANQFYYLHDTISDDEEELNPTLYIGKFKD